MTRADILILGHSHVGASLRAARDTAVPRSRGYVLLLLGQPDFAPNITGKQVNPVIRTALENTLRDGTATPLPYHTNLARPGVFPAGCPIFTAVGGNDHNALGLVTHARPFDFVLPECSDLPFLDDAEVVPYQLVRSTLAKRVRRWTQLMNTFAEWSGRPVYQLESPPPFSDDDYVSKNLDQFFRDRDPGSQVVARSLRYKLWRLNASLLREGCDERRTFYVPVPHNTTNAEGYLIRDYYAGDATHANAKYGALQLEQMDGILAQWERTAA